MNYTDWKIGTYKNFEDPTYYNEPSKYCEICDIEEDRTYFVENTNICEDCHEEEQKQNFINIIKKIKKLKK
tara:strand:+ start:150 stop:362 length:213 start_codon:yes stop_codon:yes gene_type:complete